MEWRFSLIDRFGTITDVDEPVGWDGIQIRLKRDKDWHGVFFDYQTDNFEFWNDSRNLILTEYELYGIEGILFLRVEYNCLDGAVSWKHFYTGRLLFANYDSTCGDDCFVKIGIENISAILEMRNRYDQKVDLFATKCFDTISNLAIYDKAPFTTILPSKSIRLISRASLNKEMLGDNLKDNPEWHENVSSSGTDQMNATIIPGYNNVEATSISDTTFYDTAQIFNGGFNNMPGVGQVPLLDLKAFSMLKCVGESFTLKARLKGTVFQTQGSGAPQPSSTARLVIFRLPDGADDTQPGSYITLFNQVLFSSLKGTGSASFDVNVDLTFNMNTGDQLWYQVFFQTNPNRISAFFFNEHPETFLEVSCLSICDPSPAQVFMINEAISRVLESITNNKLKLYSEYLGRVDSQPFAMQSNGCGGLEAISNGLLVRQARKTDGTQPSMFVSLKDLFEGMQDIHNLGLGVEPVKAKGGDFNFDYNDDFSNYQGEGFHVRIENWKWFYKDQVIFSCKDVDKIDKTAVAEKHVAVVKIGYDKWEAEEYTGLDEFLTKREFRTQLTQVDNTFEKLCKMIASGFALEVTRRKQNDTSDWRYDNEIFIMCMEPDGSTYKVELGKILNALNIVDPATIINFRISPVRNLLRWFDTLMASYRNFTPDSKLLFSSGDGNFIAEGELDSTFCKLESHALRENQDLSIADFIDAEDGTPSVRFETVKFEYPVTIEDFKMISANLYGLIEYDNGCEQGEGWIDDITYAPNSGKATFQLIPKVK